MVVQLDVSSGGMKLLFGIEMDISGSVSDICT
jgi:hypothetical protein